MKNADQTPPTHTDRSAPAHEAPGADDLADAYGIGVSVRFPRLAEHRDIEQ